MIRYKIYLLLLTVLFASCEDDAGNVLSDQDKTRILLSKRWSIAYLTLDGVDITDYGYSQFEIEFTRQGSWSTVQGGDVFAPSGTWSFSGNQVNVIIMSGIEVSITLNPQGANLLLNFQLLDNTPIGGRVTSVAGNYELFLTPKYPPQ